MKNIILYSEDIENKIRRISFEIIEKNFDKEIIFIVGLLPNGKYISKKISESIMKNSNLSVKNLHFSYNINKGEFFCE